MITHLKGQLTAKKAPDIVVDVQGIGYAIGVSMTTFAKLPEIGNPVYLHTHLVVREDAHLLYGFFDLEERTLFRHLIKVSGIGAKIALAILSGMEPDQLVVNLTGGQTDLLVKIPGIGRKTAERLVVEMQDRLQNWQFHQSEFNGQVSVNQPVVSEAQEALMALGYKVKDAKRLIDQVDNKAVSAAELVKAALQQC